MIGRTVADLVKAELTRPAVTAPARRGLLVRTLGRDEVAELIAALSDFSVDDQGKPVELVVSLSEQRRAEDPTLAAHAGDQTLTYYRNNVSRGLVLIELDPFSDVSGQKHFRTVSDGHVRAMAPELLAQSWAVTNDAGIHPPPEVLTERLERLGESFRRIDESLRPWVAFLLSVIDGTSTQDVVTADDVVATIGESLPTLGLFRDPRLFEHRNIDRELARNRHIAQLRDPNGRELEQEDLLKRIDMAKFGGGDQPLSEDDESALSASAREYVMDRSLANRRAAPAYRDWIRVFEAKAKRGLGEQIRAHLQSSNLEAPLERFEELEIEADLDDKDQDAAQRLSDDEFDVGNGRNLAEVLPTTLRRRVERLATPDIQRVDEPLRGILQALVSLGGGEGSTIALRGLDPIQPRGTRSLFALLYGPTLAEVSSACGDRFQVQPELLHVEALPSLADSDDVDEDVNDWEELRLAVTTEDGESAVTLAWAPANLAALALFARLITAASDREWPLRIEGFEDFAEEARDSLPDAPVTEVPDSSAAADWLECRRIFFKDCAERGLNSAALEAHHRKWTAAASELLQRDPTSVDIRTREVPAFLDVDLAVTEGGREVWMLATHPLRLRWLARDLAEMRDHIVAAVRGELSLNPENATLFFRWLERVSPHRQPPMLCYDERTYLPTREVALHEQYVRTEVHRDSVGDQMDARTIGELAGVVDSYLDAFPSKIDRFVMLLLTRAGDVQLVERLIRRVLLERRATGRDQVLELHVVSPVEHHAALSMAAAGVTVEDAPAALLPKLRTVLHSWPADGMPVLEGVDAEIDIAFVPEVLGSRSTLNDGTGHRAGLRAFDAWLDKPISVPGSARHRTDVEIDLLPMERDESLEVWSTLNVWRRRQRVGSDSEDVDHVTIAVEVNRGLELFEQLHRLAQWVVTVDEFVGREQIDAIAEPPDVILVRPGTGKNELYTLVVSSRAGRVFVESGLRRKLRRMDLDLDASELDRLAGRLYDFARNTAPSVVLRAIGLGRTLEEILGLVTTRILVDEYLPSPSGVGADWWISLDDHIDWFGGGRKPRADVARVSLRVSDRQPLLSISVIEAKFRRSDEVEKAIRQVKRTTRILGAGLDREHERADSRFWREEIARALDGVSQRPLPVGELGGFVPVGETSDDVLDGLRDALRQGNYELSVSGIACSIAVDVQGGLEQSALEEVDVLRVPRGATRDVLRSLVGMAPTASGEALEADATPAALRSEVSTTSGVADNAAAVDASVVAPRGRLSDEELRRRLQRVVDKLDELRVPVSVPDDEVFDEGPAFYVLRVLPGRGVRVQQIEQRSEDLELALGLDAEQALRIYTHQGAVNIEVPKAPAERYPVEAESLWQRVPIDDDRLVIPMGEDVSGDAISLDLSSPDSPHLLMAGITGSGKSVALRTLLDGACRYDASQLRVLAVDPKRTELSFLEDRPHLEGRVGVNADDAIEVLARATEEMERRYVLMAGARLNVVEDYNRTNPEEMLPWWLLVLDEYADLAFDAESRRRIEPDMLRLAAKARAAGIHLVLATQRPSADILNSSVRANFSAQLALRVRSNTDSQIIIGAGGAEALAGQGDALLRTNRGLTRMQCAMVT